VPKSLKKRLCNRWLKEESRYIACKARRQKLGERQELEHEDKVLESPK
jgi:hypothetical protein